MRYRLRKGFPALDRNGDVVKGSDKLGWTLEGDDPLYLAQKHKFEPVPEDPKPQAPPPRQEPPKKAIDAAPMNRSMASPMRK